MQSKMKLFMMSLLLCAVLLFAACYTVESNAALTVSSAAIPNEAAQEVPTTAETLTNIEQQTTPDQKNEQTTAPPPETAPEETIPPKTVPVHTFPVYYTVISPEQTTIEQQEPTVPDYPTPDYPTPDYSSSEEERTQPSAPDGSSLEGMNAPTEYDFFSPVPKGKMQDVDYFDDAIFIGNSRMLGFGEYSNLENIRVFASAGLSVRTIYNEKSFETPNGKISIMDAVAQTPAFGKVYLKIGMNELGWEYPEVFINEYVQLINKIKEYSPDAVIYIHSILPVSKKKSTIDPWENQPRINEYNELLLRMCGENGYYYLDVQSIYLDEEGFLQNDFSFDGSHIRSNHYQPWVDYLLCHTVENSSTELPTDKEAEEVPESTTEQTTQE